MVVDLELKFVCFISPGVSQSFVQFSPEAPGFFYLGINPLRSQA